MTNHIKTCFGGRFEGRTVLVTGHTGFKGSWLCLWLHLMGAKVVGYSLPAPTSPNHFDLLDLEIQSHIDDVKNLQSLSRVFEQVQPEIVFHLAAQPLVRLSYQEPVETFTSNLDGTVNVLEAARRVSSIGAIVCVTSDKVYENQESETGYCESDPLGGADPYSASKACCELIVKSYRDSFFSNNSSGNQNSTLIATARAGHVFGGGDWAADRLVPDAVRAAAAGKSMELRNPGSVRPWQHVLEPLTGYLLLADRLLQGDRDLATAINFGPNPEGNVSVSALVDQMKLTWPEVTWSSPNLNSGPHETNILKLDSGFARRALGWTPVWNWQRAVERTTQWYRNYYESKHVDTVEDLGQFVRDAEALGMEWAA